MAYTTTTKIEAELRAPSAFSVNTIPSLVQVTEWITETTDYIDSLTGTSFASTSRTEFHNYNPSDENVYLTHTPLISVTDIAYNVSPMGVTPSYVGRVVDEDYVVYENEGRVFINLSRWQPNHSHPKAIRVNYTSGYSTVPGRVAMLATKLVAKRVLDSLIMNNVNERNAGGSISVGSINIVEPNDYGIGSYSKLGTDIKDLTSQILYQDFRVYRYE